MQTLLDEILFNATHKEVALKHLIKKARRNGSSSRKYRKQKHISVSMVVRLLWNSTRGRHIALKLKAKYLLKRMASKPWRIVGAWHRGGTGGRFGSPDGILHITLRTAKGDYHLRADKRWNLFDITGPGLRRIPPYIAPGAPIVYTKKSLPNSI